MFEAFSEWVYLRNEQWINPKDWDLHPISCDLLQWTITKKQQPACYRVLTNFNSSFAGLNQPLALSWWCWCLGREGLMWSKHAMHVLKWLVASHIISKLSSRHWWKTINKQVGGVQTLSCILYKIGLHPALSCDIRLLADTKHVEHFICLESQGWLMVSHGIYTSCWEGSFIWMSFTHHIWKIRVRQNEFRQPYYMSH